MKQKKISSQQKKKMKFFKKNHFRQHGSKRKSRKIQSNGLVDQNIRLLKKKARGQNVIGNLTNNFITQLKVIKAPIYKDLIPQDGNETEIKEQTLFNQLQQVKVFKKSKKQLIKEQSKTKILSEEEPQQFTKKYQNKSLFPISTTVCSNIVNFIIVAYYYWKQFQYKKKDKHIRTHHKIVQKMIRNVKFNLIEYIFAKGSKEIIEAKRQDINMRRNIFFFYCYLQQNLKDIQDNSKKMIQNLINIAFRDKNKKSDIKFCKNQIQALLQKVRNNDFEGLFIEKQTSHKNNRAEQQSQKHQQLDQNRNPQHIQKTQHSQYFH